MRLGGTGGYNIPHEQYVHPPHPQYVLLSLRIPLGLRFVDHYPHQVIVILISWQPENIQINKTFYTNSFFLPDFPELPRRDLVIPHPLLLPFLLPIHSISEKPKIPEHNFDDFILKKNLKN